MSKAERWSQEDSEADEITLRLSEAAIRENSHVLKYSDQMLDELGKIARSQSGYGAIIIDATEVGFLFPADEMLAAAELARNLLQEQGAIVFVKQDKAAAFVKESSAGALACHIFESFSAVYDFSTDIAKSIQQAMGQNIEIRREGADLAEQVLLTVVPVLTDFGIKIKASVEGSARRNQVLAAINNYSPINAIAQSLSQHMSMDTLLDELKQLEKLNAVYPIFPKIPFLVQQFRGGKNFRLKDYLIEARMLTAEQIDDLLFSIQNTKGAGRLGLGAMAVSKGFLSARQLEIALQDQAFFGQVQERERSKVRVESDSHMQSLVGNLKTTEPASLLQNLAGSRSSGVVVVESKDLTFRAFFDQGKLALARLGKLKGNTAVVEFVSVWKDGIFVFLERTAPPDLSGAECQVTKALEKLLMDSALASDNIEAVWAKLPQGPATILERVADNSGLLSSTQLRDPQEGYELQESDRSDMQRVWHAADGLGKISDLIKSHGDLTTIQVATAISRLFYYKLLSLGNMDIQTPLSRFRKIVSVTTSHIGIERTEVLLKISLRESQGYSAASRVFLIASATEVGIDLAAAKATGLSLMRVAKALDDWRLRYLQHVSQEMDQYLLRKIVNDVYSN